MRPSAKELLKNKMFNNIRIPAIEEPAPHKIVVDIDINNYKQHYNEEDDNAQLDKEIIQIIQVNIVKDFMKLTKNTKNIKIKVINK